ncbi:IS200/IS605 family transposase [Cryomorpha ignava]|uniref:IS200/IS605 family transposase n=1 Tax=Cryomorpha ignava TaxID=101383 RepID=A0A7K3WP40_9FLAO|nr:IS200/IS605 family transposase [Cryomorpha ignava]NEN23429.1 IS200/IS605 family transposase [Cryomorpha ignava]
MANAFSKQYVHAIFAVKYRKSTFSPEIKPTAFAIIAQQVKDTGCDSLIVNGVEDHVHCLFSIPPKFSTSEILQKIKGNSSKDFNKLEMFDTPFRWQTGYGAFSQSYRELDMIYKYIENQEAHHRTESFPDEFLRLLTEQNIDFDPKYLFESLQ